MTETERANLVDECLCLAAKLVGKLWKRGYLRSLGREDAYQEASCAVLKAFKKVDWGRDPREIRAFVVRAVRRHLHERERRNGIVSIPTWRLRGDCRAERPDVYFEALRRKKWNDFYGDYFYFDEEGFRRIELEDLERCLSRLTPEESDLVRCRFGLGGQSPVSLREYGERFNLSHEMIRQKLSAVLQRLKEMME